MRRPLQLFLVGRRGILLQFGDASWQIFDEVLDHRRHRFAVELLYQLVEPRNRDRWASARALLAEGAESSADSSWASEGNRKSTWLPDAVSILQESARHEAEEAHA